MRSVKDCLKDIEQLLQKNGEPLFAEMIIKALSGDEDCLWKFLISNELWGGAGSVADQALLDNKIARKSLEEALIELAKLQQESGRVNVRTKMWVDAFGEWMEMRKE